MINNRDDGVTNFDLDEFSDKPARSPGEANVLSPIHRLFRSDRNSCGDLDGDYYDDSLFSKSSCQYEVHGDGGLISFKPTGETVKILPPGVYSVTLNNQDQVTFERKNIVVDDLIEVSSGIHKKILNEISTFWEKGDLFSQHGFLHRRGYMLYGPPGGGKTCLLQLILSSIQEQGGIAFIADGSPSVMEAGLKVFRVIEPNRPVVCVFEDLDAIVERHGDSSVLSLLDGESQIDKVLNLATTNYPEKLDKRLVARPRRFDRVVKIGMPDEEMRRQFFTKKLNLNADEIEVWVKSTDGFSFASMAELVISVKCLGNDFEDMISRMEQMSRISPSSNDDRPRLGFGF